MPRRRRAHATRGARERASATKTNQRIETLALVKLLDYLPMVEVPELGSSAQQQKRLSVRERNAAPAPERRGRSAFTDEGRRHEEDARPGLVLLFALHTRPAGLARRRPARSDA